MWHEARKQEKLIRGLIVDYRRRAERRRDYYEKIKADPTQFLQVHGRQCKIHLDPAVTIAGDSPAIMMPWQGDTNNMIDRFDARAHLDYIVDVKNPEINVDDLEQEERQCNYERYRILAQNTFLGISEQKFLHQLSIEEQFGVTIDEREATKEKNEKKGTGAMIGYNYDDPTAQPPITAEVVNKAVLPQSSKESDDDDESDLEVLDVDLSIDVNKMEPSQAHELNTIGPHYGMAGCDLFSFLTGDADEVEQQRQQMREEKEKAMFSGRKSRRERRAHRDKRQLNRVLSPPSYAAPKEEVTKIRRENSRSLSRSPSPHQEKIEFITSFGGDEEEKSSKSKTYAEKLKTNLKQRLSYSDALKGVSRLPDKARREMGPSFLDSDDKYRKVKDRSRSRIRKSRSRSYSRLHRSRSRSYRSRSCSRSYRSRSRSRRSYRSRSSDSSCSSKSRKRSLSRSRYTKTNNTRNYQRRSRSVGSDNVKQKPIPRYYGRKRDENRSSSELSLDSDSSDTPTTCVTANVKAAGVKLKPNPRVTGSSNKDHSNKGETLTLKERLKRKMQAQLNKQLKADQKAEAARREREALEQASREEDHMRQLAARKKRQERDRSRSNSQSSGSRTSSSDRKSSEHRSRKKHSSSRSKSPNPGDRSPENSGGHSRGGYHTSGSSGSRHYEGISGGDHRDREERSYREGRSYRSYDNNRYDKYSEGYQRSYSRNHSRGSDNHHKDNGDGYRKRDSYRRSDDSKEPSYKVRKLVDY